MHKAYKWFWRDWEGDGMHRKDYPKEDCGEFEMEQVVRESGLFNAHVELMLPVRRDGEEEIIGFRYLVIGWMK